MNQLRGWFLSRRRVVCSLEKYTQQWGAISAARSYIAVQGKGRKDMSSISPYSTSSPKQSKRTYLHEVQTFRPDKFDLVKQPILEFPQRKAIQLRIMNKLQPRPEPCMIRYAISEQRLLPFPAGTRGVLYFHHVPGDILQSQVRFRLCESLDKFENGEDLRLSGGELWNVTLKGLGRTPKCYRAALTLLQTEFPLTPQEVDSRHNCHRVIPTFDPQKLQMLAQGVMDISGVSSARVSASADKNSTVSLLYRVAMHEKKKSVALVYPPDTVGVFYYKQSRTAPTRLGELRFRLCRDVREFDQGSDLCLPSGEIWSLSSLTIHSGLMYKHLREALTKEGLLEDTLYPDVSRSLLTKSTMPLRVLSDPFIIDLSTARVRFDIISVSLPTTIQRIDIQHMFCKHCGTGDSPLFSGRAVVRFEEYPGLPIGNNPSGRLLALRFLEILTPVTCVSGNDYTALPKEGELFTVRRRTGKYEPWGFNPRTQRKVLADWIARSRA